MTLLFSSANFQSGTSYTIYKGGSVSGRSDFHRLYTGVTYTNGRSASTFTPGSIVTTVGSSGGGDGSERP